MRSSSFDMLKAFFSEMHEWEKKYYAITRALIESNVPRAQVDAVKAEAVDTAAAIFDRYGIAGKKNRNRLAGLHLGDPPTYEAEPYVDAVLEESDTRVTFLVKKLTGPQGQYRYTLSMKSGTWVLSKREFLDCEDKWRPFAF